MVAIFQKGHLSTAAFPAWSLTLRDDIKSTMVGKELGKSSREINKDFRARWFSTGQGNGKQDIPQLSSALS